VADQEVSYHFRDVHSVTTSEDGVHIILNVTGAGGIFGLSIERVKIPAVVGMLLSASAGAEKIAKTKTTEALTAGGLQVLEEPNSDRVMLGVHLPGGILPVRLQREDLLEFAHQLLQSAGELPFDRPSSVQ
jgi:hypothetical protein